MKKILLTVFILILVAVGGWFGYDAYYVSKIPPVTPAAEQLMIEAIKTVPSTAPESPEGKALKDAIVNSWSFEIEDSYRDKREAIQKLNISYLDVDSLYTGLQENAQAVLQREVENAGHSRNVYNEDYSYKPEVLEAAASEAFKLAFENAELKTDRIELWLRYEDGNWNCEPDSMEYVYERLWPAGFNPDAFAAELCAAAVENPQYVRKIYTIDEYAKAGPEPDRSKFGSTTDPSVIEALISEPLSQELINGQELAWNKDIELIPGSQIHYYRDESILTIVWQEVEAQAVGTFAETFIAHGSQLRRKIADDTFESFNHQLATELSRQSNAVLALGGDLYHHDRACGIMVYEREIYRFEPYTSDTCYITTDGDMLFSYRNQFTDISQAQQFIEDNDVLFSICFGPVLIDDGKDVTPQYYTWGEVNDFYARSALGMLGDKHYLSMNINCKQPGYYFLATLRQAADAMIEKGCIKAYALDGGQTAATIINNQLINPVQFGWERTTSDIIYFATAVPNE